MINPHEFLKDTLIIKAKTKSELNKLISRNHGKYKFLAVQGSNDEVNRAALEDKRVDLLLNPEIERTRDFSDWRNSGLNDVLCRFAAQNKVSIGIDLSTFPSEKFSLAERLGRIMQNIKLCRKFKAKMIVFSSETSINDHDLMSISLALGMSTEQTKTSLSILEKK
jgi:ribonuclease P/MRP protein subunit RPP1